MRLSNLNSWHAYLTQIRNGISRSVEGIWSAKQSVILATRPYPLNIELTCFGLKDKGTAFVDALEKRQQPSLGSFIIHDVNEDAKLFSSANLKCLFKLDMTFKMLKFGALQKECALLPLSVKTDTLVYKIEAVHFQPTEIDSLDIVAKNLEVTIYLNDVEDCFEPLVSFLNRIAELGHFERLSFFVAYWGDGYNEEHDVDDDGRVAEALIRAIIANPKLEFLDISRAADCVRWFYHFKEIFEVLEDRKTLRTFILPDLVAPLFYMKDKKFERLCLRHPVNDYLEKLISRNRNITVYDRFHKKCSIAPRIHKIYSLNAFFNGSAEVVKEASSERLLLVAAALIERAAKNFQYSALLLSGHTDMLCDLIKDINVEETVGIPEETSLPASYTTDPSKRKTRIQLPRAAKKAA